MLLIDWAQMDILQSPSCPKMWEFLRKMFFSWPYLQMYTTTMLTSIVKLTSRNGRMRGVSYKRLFFQWYWTFDVWMVNCKERSFFYNVWQARAIARMSLQNFYKEKPADHKARYSANCFENFVGLKFSWCCICSFLVCRSANIIIFIDNTGQQRKKRSSNNYLFCFYKLHCIRFWYPLLQELDSFCKKLFWSSENHHIQHF